MSGRKSGVVSSVIYVRNSSVIYLLNYLLLSRIRRRNDVDCKYFPESSAQEKKKETVNRISVERKVACGLSQRRNLIERNHKI